MKQKEREEAKWKERDKMECRIEHSGQKAACTSFSLCLSLSVFSEE